MITDRLCVYFPGQGRAVREKDNDEINIVISPLGKTLLSMY